MGVPIAQGGKVIEWVSVTSSAIRKVGYDARTSRMYIDFEDSDPYYTLLFVGYRSRFFESS